MRQIDDHVRAAIKRRATETPAPIAAERPEEVSEVAETPELPPPPRLFERRGGRFVLFPDAFDAADASARAQLAAQLRRFLTVLEASGA